MAVEFVDDVDAAVAAWVRKSGVAKRAKRPAPEESLAARPLRLGIGAKFVPHSKEKTLLEKKIERAEVRRKRAELEEQEAAAPSSSSDESEARDSKTAVRRASPPRVRDVAAAEARPNQRGDGAARKRPRAGERPAALGCDLGVGAAAARAQVTMPPSATRAPASVAAGAAGDGAASAEGLTKRQLKKLKQRLKRRQGAAVATAATVVPPPPPAADAAGDGDAPAAASVVELSAHPLVL